MLQHTHIHAGASTTRRLEIVANTKFHPFLKRLSDYMESQRALGGGESVDSKDGLKVAKQA